MYKIMILLWYYSKSIDIYIIFIRLCRAELVRADYFFFQDYTLSFLSAMLHWSLDCCCRLIETKFVAIWSQKQLGQQLLFSAADSAFHIKIDWSFLLQFHPALGGYSFHVEPSSTLQGKKKSNRQVFIWTWNCLLF